jgi:hypothetical protein
VRISRTVPHRARHVSTNLTFDNESEEHIIEGENLKLQHVQGATNQQRGEDVIVVTSQVNVTPEDRDGARSPETFQVL